VKFVFLVGQCAVGHPMPEKVAMAITASSHNRTMSWNFETTGCVTGLLDRWTLTGTSPCCRLCACIGDGRCNR
jgi:hypothetical protein